MVWCSDQQCRALYRTAFQTIDATDFPNSMSRKLYRSSAKRPKHPIKPGRSMKALINARLRRSGRPDRGPNIYLRDKNGHLVIAESSLEKVVNATQLWLIKLNETANQVRNGFLDGNVAVPHGIDQQTALAKVNEIITASSRLHDEIDGLTGANKDLHGRDESSDKGWWALNFTRDGLLQSPEVAHPPHPVAELIFSKHDEVISAQVVHTHAERTQIERPSPGSPSMIVFDTEADTNDPVENQNTTFTERQRIDSWCDDFLAQFKAKLLKNPDLTIDQRAAFTDMIEGVQAWQRCYPPNQTSHWK